MFTASVAFAPGVAADEAVPKGGAGPDAEAANRVVVPETSRAREQLHTGHEREDVFGAVSQAVVHQRAIGDSDRHWQIRDLALFAGARHLRWRGV